MLELTFNQLQKLLMQNQLVADKEDAGRQLYHTTYTSIIDTNICQGNAVSTSIRQGITFMDLQLTFRQDTRIEVLSVEPQIGFAFCLKGSVSVFRKNTQYIKGSEVSFTFASRTGYLYITAASDGWYEFGANQPFHAMYIHFNYAAFKQLLGEQFAELPVDFIGAFESPNGYFIKYKRLSRPVIALCESLLANPFTGKSKQFYIEAKAIELIAYQIDELVKSTDEIDATGPQLTLKEEEQIEHCYHLLLDNLDHPPSLIALAKQIGMSDYRLKNAFRLKYGLTPYRFVAQQRMIKARCLLEKGRMNVSEVALEVGFSSLGSFSNSFYETFGIRPSEIK